MKKLIPGINDLKTLFPEIAKEADGWDPSTVLADTHTKMRWKCEKGHTWETTLAHRTLSKSCCPYCSNTKVWAGFNDLKTLFPEIAKEADGWDPSTFVSGSNKRLPWKCEKGHTWETTLAHRTRRRSGCPYCSNRKVWIGFNDLKTLFPEVAAEANGWDPSTVLAGTHTKMRWKCNQGHLWSAIVKSRTGLNKTGCPYCSNNKVWTGFNDLKTLFPEIAKEADGWDPSTVLAGTHTKMRWKCNQGHTWNTTSNKRTGRGDACPYCSRKKVWTGFNDLKTLFPEIAKEADGWDPSTVLPGINKKMSWKCKEGHTWITSANARTGLNKTGCPYCSNNKVWTGFNDLKTLFPEIAQEANGWDPSTVLAGSNKKMFWKCKERHTWYAKPTDRTCGGTGCPRCAAGGFNPGEPAWFYLMARPGEQQLGITNNLARRRKDHAALGWQEIEATGPHSGQKVLDTENTFKKWLRKKVGLIPHTTENWYTSKMEFHSLAELKERSGIETSIF